MRSLKFTLFFFSLGLIACSTTKENITKNTFTFYYHGVKHQIISKNTSSGEGTNYLLDFTDLSNTVITSTDIDQDGTLDVLLDQNSTLEQENAIYQAGIMIAMRSGNYRVQETLRTYEVTRNDSVFTVKTYLDTEALSNLYIQKIRNTAEEWILRDLDSNGGLDQFEKGSGDISAFQQGYIRLLEQGVKENKITLNNGIYTVNKLEKVRTSHYDTAEN